MEDQIFFPNSSDNCNPDPTTFNTNVKRPWTRGSGQQSLLSQTITTTDLNKRRNAEILKYKNTGNLTKKQRYARVATNSLIKRTSTFANQSFNKSGTTNSNIKNLPLVNNSLILPNSTQNQEYTNLMKNIPLTRYNPERRQYRGGNTKWPQLSFPKKRN